MIYILRGEGIECENESYRALSTLGFHTQYLNIADILNNSEATQSLFKENDWLFLPGGFSFADHLGSGRLLSFELEKSQFFQNIVKKGVSLFGVCNGFQILVATSLFGDVKLLHNKDGKSESMHFTDKWTKINFQFPDKKTDFSFPVRHGEGRLSIQKLAPDTEAWAYYEDFHNGSDQKIAGLRRRIEKSWIIGLMPHPEIYTQVEAHPDYVWSEDSPEMRKAHASRYAAFFKSIFNENNLKETQT